MKLQIVWALLILALLQAAPAGAGQKITIVRGQDFPPYHYLDGSSRVTGFLVDLILKAGERMDLSIRFKQLPWSRCLHVVRIGEADAMMNLFKTRERTTFMIFPDTPLTREINRLFTLGENDLEFTGDLARLKGIKIGAVRNYSYGKAFDSVAGQLNIVRLETEKSLIMNLAGHRCDAIIGNEVVVNILKGQIPGAALIRPVGPAVTNDPLYIGFSKARGHENLARDFSRALKAVKESPDYQQRLKAYGL